MARVPNLLSCIKSLEENPKEVFLEVTSILLKLANNVIEHPTNPKYRTVNLANPIISGTLLPAIGALECLFEMGFEEANEALVLPQRNDLRNITLARDELLKRRNAILAPVHSPPLFETKKAFTSQACTSKSMPSTSSKVNTFANHHIIAHRTFILQQIASFSTLASEYESESLKKRARACIPLPLLEKVAVQRLRDAQIAIKTMKNIESVEEPSLQQMLLLELLNWFKNSFFTWVDTLPCFYCSKETELCRKDESQPFLIEVFKCKSCCKETIFPRYTDPKMLLITRRGRCGEWANCFTFLCRSLGWDARLVFDVTDHIWTEVFLLNLDRWVHCDPCENACDQPLMYELGWNKQLSYIFGFSCDDVQDVSWRYSSRHADMRNRRKLFKESDLLDIIVKVREKLQESLTPSRKAFLARRTLKELIEFLKEPVGDASNYSGRCSGSLTWRLARGETATMESSSSHVWKPNATEIEKRCIQIEYCTATDTYKRPQGGDVILKGWQNGTYKVKSVFRKEERDWKMVYLARTEGSEEGHIEWKVDLQETGFVVDTITIFVNTFTCENGKAISMICGKNSCLFVGGSELTTNALCGEESVTLKVYLKGGHGSVAWQHAQILRASVNSEDITLDIKVRLKPRSQ